jgi:hypothetical protein
LWLDKNNGSAAEAARFSISIPHKGEQSMLRQLIVLSVLGLTALFGVAALAQDAAGPAVRIGIVLPKAQLGQGNTGQDVANPVRQLITSYMAGPVLTLVPLEARIPAQISAEARAQNCTHILYTAVEQKKGGRGMGGFMSKMAPVAGALPGVGALGGSAAAMAAGVATQVITQQAQQEAMDSLTQAQAGSVKARDEIGLHYQLVTVSGAKPVLEDTLTAKAKEDGEDLLTPLVEQLATIAVTAALEP